MFPFIGAKIGVAVFVVANNACSFGPRDGGEEVVSCQGTHLRWEDRSDPPTSEIL